MKLISDGLTPLIVIAALIAAGAWMARSSAAKKELAEKETEKKAVATITVSQGDFEVIVKAIGKLEAVKSMPVMAEVTGQVLRVIPNGTRVKKGDVIIELDTPRMSRMLRENEIQYQNSTAQLEKRKRELATEVEKAKDSLKQAESELAQFKVSQKSDLAAKQRQTEYDAGELELTRERVERKKRQAKEALLPLREVELAEADLKVREFGLERARKELQLMEKRQESDLLDKEAAVQKAQADLARAEATQQDEIQNGMMSLQIQKQQMDRGKDQLSKAIVKAPADGIVALESSWQRFGGTQRELSSGDPVYEGQKLATIPDLSKMQVLVELTQDQVRMVKRKCQARVKVESAPHKIFDGEVTEISTTAREQNLEGGGWMSTGERVFQTYLELKNTKGTYLRPGTSSVVNIIIERIPKALTIPLECVFNQDDKRIVYTLRNGNFLPIEVKLGPQNEDVVVVKKGLRVGDKIALHDVKELRSDAARDVLSKPLATPSR